jgi:fluoride ion exporter CrcB/FEX
MALIRDGSMAAGLGNIAASLLLCLGSTWLGLLLGRLL